MKDITYCVSKKCPLRDTCKRNAYVLDSYKNVSMCDFYKPGETCMTFMGEMNLLYDS